MRLVFCLYAEGDGGGLGRDGGGRGATALPASDSVGQATLCPPQKIHAGGCAVAGRLKSDCRYSTAMVYNNFPWPTGAGAAEPSGTQGTDRTQKTGAAGEATGETAPGAIGEAPLSDGAAGDCPVRPYSSSASCLSHASFFCLGDRRGRHRAGARNLCCTPHRNSMSSMKTSSSPICLIGRTFA